MKFGKTWKLTDDMQVVDQCSSANKTLIELVHENCLRKLIEKLLKFFKIVEIIVLK